MGWLWVLGMRLLGFVGPSNLERKQEWDFCCVLSGGTHLLPQPVNPVPGALLVPLPGQPLPSQPGCAFLCSSGTRSGSNEDLSQIQALMLSLSPSPPTPIILPWMIDVPYPAWLQYIHCHAEDVVNSLLVFHIKAADIF